MMIALSTLRGNPHLCDLPRDDAKRPVAWEGMRRRSLPLSTRFLSTGEGRRRRVLLAALEMGVNSLPHLPPHPRDELLNDWQIGWHRLLVNVLRLLIFFQRGGVLALLLVDSTQELQNLTYLRIT